MLIDGHNIAYKCLYSNIYCYPNDVNFDMWKHSFLSEIFKIIIKINPDVVIFAFDEKNSWRYDIYPNYKLHRKQIKKKNKFDINWELFFNVFDNFIEDIKNTFNFYIIKLQRTEGDDIIATCTNDIFINDNIYIISNDKDMYQLKKRKNIYQFDPRKFQFVECLNPSVHLKIKILTGDTSDFIKSIRYGVGVKTAEKIIETGLDNYVNNIKFNITNNMKKSEWMSDCDIDKYCTQSHTLNNEDINYFITKEKEQIYLNYITNKKLIDFKNIPEYIKNRIINTYNNYMINSINKNNLISFFMKHKLIKIMNDWNLISTNIKKINNEKRI